MKYFSERKAEAFLERRGFNIVKRAYCSKKSFLKSAIKKVGGFPLVMKVSGESIVHKNKMGGVFVGVKTYSHALDIFISFKKMKGVSGVILQKMIPFEREFLVGVKKTKDFGHVVIFGNGGVKTEIKKDVVFRVVPVNKKEIREMIKETKIGKKLSLKELRIIEDLILKICALVSKNLNINEFDINPFVIYRGQGYVLDSRILFN
jgi:hypothetical protein